MDFAEFCTCGDRKCPYHPTNHDQGCTLCIAKNRKLGEIPSCFFNQLKDKSERTGYTFEDFAKAVLAQE